MKSELLARSTGLKLNLKVERGHVEPMQFTFPLPVVPKEIPKVPPTEKVTIVLDKDRGIFKIK